ncbi:MAG: helix-turn-helix domain-containing protein [Candidatus Cryptobacteroides sp.]
MKNDYLKWRERIDEITPSDHRIGSDILLMECASEEHIWTVSGAFKSDVSMCCIYSKGWAKMRINMREYVAKAPCLLVVMSGQVFEAIGHSEDIEAKVIVMSDKFTKSMFPNFGIAHPFYSSIFKNPVVPLKEGCKVFDQFFDMMLDLASSKSVEHKIEAARHLTLTMFFGYGFKAHDIPKNPDNGNHRQEIIYSRFIELVELHHKTEREVAFYADKLCITPKYLSQIVKDVTGRTALDCIEDYVVSEAKAMLSLTARSIQEISYELHFPSQSVFGKYFKRVTGLSPKQYRMTFR